MKIREVMSSPVVRISPEESVSVASRTLTHSNIGAVPVCGADGKLCGMLTDRDIVTRCLAAGKIPGQTKVREVMSSGISVVRPDMEAETAAALMSSKQIRRLPVMENGRLCGIVSLADLALHKNADVKTGEVLAQISSGVSSRE